MAAIAHYPRGDQMTASPNLNDPKEISRIGRQIYEAKYKAEYESKHAGMFAAINISDESAALGATPMEALKNAQALNPKGFYHLIRVGHPGLFEVGFAYRYVSTDRLSG
jgi:hypothetical protein